MLSKKEQEVLDRTNEILVRAQNEIIRLRRDNSTMSLRLKMFDDIMTLINIRPPHDTMGMCNEAEDILQQIKQLISEPRHSD